MDAMRLVLPWRCPLFATSLAGAFVLLKLTSRSALYKVILCFHCSVEFAPNCQFASLKMGKICTVK